MLSNSKMMATTASNSISVNALFPRRMFINKCPSIRFACYTPPAAGSNELPVLPSDLKMHDVSSGA